VKAQLIDRIHSYHCDEKLILNQQSIAFFCRHKGTPSKRYCGATAGYRVLAVHQTIPFRQEENPRKPGTNACLFALYL
jgi:hypothetical protein